MSEIIQSPKQSIPETVQDIPPIIAAVDVGSLEEAYSFIDAIDSISNEGLGIKIPHGLAMRHYDKFVLPLRSAGRFTVVDSRFNDYTNKIGDELATSLQTNLPQDPNGNPPHDLPNAFTMLALREGLQADRQRMAHEIIPSAHRLGVRLFGILPPIPIAGNDNDQLANQAFNRYMDAAEVGIDAIDIPEPALQKFSRYNTLDSEIGIIASRFGHNYQTKEDIASAVSRVFEDKRVVSVYLGRPLLRLASDAERIACIELCLEKTGRI